MSNTLFEGSDSVMANLRNMINENDSMGMTVDRDTPLELWSFSASDSKGTYETDTSISDVLMHNSEVDEETLFYAGSADDAIEQLQTTGVTKCPGAQTIWYELRVKTNDIEIEVWAGDTGSDDNTLEWTGKFSEYVEEVSDNPGWEESFDEPVDVVKSKIINNGQYVNSGFVGTYFVLKHKV